MSKENFFPNELDLFNALSSKKQKVSKKYLIDELRAKGIFVPSSFTRDELVYYYSKLTINYSNCKDLMDKMKSGAKRDKWGIKQYNLDKKFDLSEFIEDFNAETTEQDESVNISLEAENKCKCDYVYSEFDLSKNPMFQKVKREASIEITIDKNIMKVRYNSNDRMNRKFKKVKSLIKKQTEIEPEEIEIDFSTIFKKSILTKFLEQLIKSIDGYSVSDVKNVKINYPKVSTKKEELYDDDLDKENEEKDVEEITEVGSQILKATFGGEGLLTSPKYYDFIQSGYYLSSIVWQLESNDQLNKNRYEIEAQFQDPVNGCNFIYNPKYKFEYNKEKNYHFDSNTKLDEDEQKDLSKKIEDAAISIYLELLKKKE